MEEVRAPVEEARTCRWEIKRQQAWTRWENVVEKNLPWPEL